MPSFVIKTKIKVERTLATNSGTVTASVTVLDAPSQAEGREIASAAVPLDTDDKNVQIRKAYLSEGLVAAVDWSSAQDEFEFTLSAGARRPHAGQPLSTAAVEFEVQANSRILDAGSMRMVLDEASRRTATG